MDGQWLVASQSLTSSGPLRGLVIEKDTRNLGPGYVIGHSYFCQAAPNGRDDTAWYEQIVRFEIAPLLEEYLAEDTDRAKDLVARLLS